MRRFLFLAALLPLSALVSGAAIGARPVPDAPAGAPSGSECRCAQLSLERYFAAAELVVVGRVEALTRVDAPDGPGHLEVRLTPLYRQGRAFKGDPNGLRFATPDNSAACGAPVEVGETWIVFGFRGAASDPDLSWFETCSGSRLYLSREGTLVDEGFLGLPGRRVLAHLFQLADGPADQLATPTPEFHTSPACWSQPRIAHQGAAPADLRDHIRVEPTAETIAQESSEASPNGAYRFVTGVAPADAPAGRRGSFVIVDVERPDRLRVTGLDAMERPTAHWINEKLLFVRFARSRVQFTDVIVDVELGTAIYGEEARYAREAFEQYREACLGQCPCLVIPGLAGELPSVPTPRGDPGDEARIPQLPQALAYLNTAWDGKVFTEPATRAFTVSALADAREETERPADILEVRFVSGGWWLRVALYRVSRCLDPAQAPVHAGWVPAFSELGTPVAGTYPRGC